MFVLLTSALISGACTNDYADQGRAPSRSPGLSTDSPPEAIPDIDGLDLLEAVRQLKRGGYEVRFEDGVSKSERAYATGRQTHPTVEVVEFEVDGNVIVITDAACPDNRDVC